MAALSSLEGAEGMPSAPSVVACEIDVSRIEVLNKRPNMRVWANSTMSLF